MLIPYKDKGEPRLAISLPRSWDRTVIPYLRDGLIDMLQTCVASEDAKEATCSSSLFYAIEFIKELNKELEDTPP